MMINKVRTPVELLNIVGCGGIEPGCMLEIWGPPKSGKSTFSYQCAELVIEDYPDGYVILILDPEGSANLLRLRRVFNLRPCNVPNPIDPDSGVFVEHGGTFEDALKIIGKYQELAISLGKLFICIWDSITASQPAKEMEAVNAAVESMIKDKEKEKAIEMFKGGMMLRPRMLKFTLNSILSMIYGQRSVIFLINQATSKIMPSFSMEDSSGGYGLKHNIAYRIKFEFHKPMDENPLYKEGTMSLMHMSKSKHGATLLNVPVIISDTQGGKFRYGEDLFYVGEMLHFVQQAGGWYKLFDIDEQPPEVKSLSKNWRFKELVLSEEAKAWIREQVVTHFRTHFKLIDWEYEEQESSEQ